MKTIISLLLIGTTCLSAFSQTAWKLAREEDGIQIFTRKLPGEPLKEFKAQMELNSSPEQILAVLLDWSNNPEWMDKCARTDLVKKVSDQNWILHSFLNAPWPVSDRDMVFSFEFMEKGGAIICKLVGLPDAVPKTEEMVRIPNYRGEWRLTPLPNGNTQVVSQALVDPGGNIPDWLANSSVVESPFTTMKNLQEVLGK